MRKDRSKHATHPPCLSSLLSPLPRYSTVTDLARLRG